MVQVGFDLLTSTEAGHSGTRTRSWTPVAVMLNRQILGKGSANNLYVLARLVIGAWPGLPSPLVAFGCHWSPLVDFGRLWQPLVAFASLSLPLVALGRPWSPLVAFGRLWSPLVAFGGLW